MQDDCNKTCVEKEVWKDVLGYEGYYQISNLGNVKSLDRIIDSGRGYKTSRKGAMLKPSYRGGNYAMVPLRKNGIQKYKMIHHLVLESFAYPRPEGMECRHLNGISWDNRLENLCWGTAKENSKDKWRHGTMPAKLTDNEVTRIRKLYHEGTHSMCHLSREFGISPTMIHHILHRKSYTHINDGYFDVGNQRKLNKKIADEIREIYKIGNLTHKSLGKLFGISGSMVCDITTNKSYK